MAFSITQHFLTEAGLSFFPDWLKETESLARRHPGYLSLRRLEAEDDPTAAWLRTEFATFSQLKAWEDSTDCQWALTRIKTHEIRHYEHLTFDVK